VGTYQVDPTRLVAAGKGKYAPVADNSTAEGRAKNRRTEIILNPDLVKLLGRGSASIRRKLPWNKKKPFEVSQSRYKRMSL
jgi:hypothetical protein